MSTALLMEIKRLFAELAATLILDRKEDAADIALVLAEKSEALAKELANS